MVTQEYLKNNFTYDPLTGIFKRNTDGYVCTKPDPSNGYLRIRIKRVLYYLHRLIWLYQTGETDIEQIDHINRNRVDNRFCNLRNVSRQTNAVNKTKQSNNTSGVTGVYFESRTNKWRGEVLLSGKKHRLGRFSNIHEAEKAVVEKRKELGFTATHGRNI